VRLAGAGAAAVEERAERSGERLVLHGNGFAILEATEDTAVADLPATPL
jgi:hypothetical protein